MMKEGSIASGISTESHIGLNITRQVNHELHTRSSTRNNLGEQERKEESGFGPVELWVMGPHCIIRVVTFHAITMQGLSRNSLSALSVTRSVPRARDEENHFPAR